MFKHKKKNVEIVDKVSEDTENKVAKMASKAKWTKRIVMLVTYGAVLYLLKSSIIIAALLCVIIGVLFKLFNHSQISDSNNNIISIWFGVPGAGKTTMAAYLTRVARKAHRRVLSNVELTDAYKLEAEDLGKYDMSFDGEGCQVIIDEASLEFDNRNFKAFVKTDAPYFFALHRHMQCKVDVFSQGVDVDKRIRDRAARMFALRKIRLKGFVMYRQIKKILYIKDEDRQLIDGFEYKGWPRLIYCKPLWSSFNTLDMTLCPTEKKEWHKWGD